MEKMKKTKGIDYRLLELEIINIGRDMNDITKQLDNRVAGTPLYLKELKKLSKLTKQSIEFNNQLLDLVNNNQD